MYLFRMEMHHSNAMRHFYGMRMTDYATKQTNQPTKFFIDPLQANNDSFCKLKKGEVWRYCD